MMWRWGMGLVLLSAMLSASVASTYSSAELLKYGHGSIEQTGANVYKLCKATGDFSDEEDKIYLGDANAAHDMASAYQPLTITARTTAFERLYAANSLAALQNRGPPGFSL